MAQKVAMVACKICGARSHILINHIKEKHGMSAEDYRNKYPDETLWSAEGLETLKKVMPKAVSNVPRMREKVKVKDVFGVDSHSPVSQWTPFPNDKAFIPILDENYVFPAQELLWLLMALELPTQNRVAIKGVSGTGKTQLVHNVAAALRIPLFRLQGDSFLSRSQVIGEYGLKNGETFFKYGILPMAMRSGGILLIDEFDCLSPYALNIVRPAMEDPPRLVVLETGGEVIVAHPDFRIVGTMNTWGTGDESGMYVNTFVQSLADRQRFSLFIEMSDIPEATEREILKRRFPALEKAEIKAFCKVSKEAKEAFKEGRLRECLSPRQLVNWAEKYLLLGGDPWTSGDLCFCNSMPADTATAMRNYIIGVFGHKKEDKNATYANLED